MSRSAEWLRLYEGALEAGASADEAAGDASRREAEALEEAAERQREGGK